MRLSRQRGLVGIVLGVAVLTAPSAQARARHSEAWAREHFVAAERMREALNGRPPTDRTRHDYQRVLNAYRNIYLGAPASAKADPSVVAVAETLVEMGRRFEDNKILHEAISQYKFLRREYPGSRYRFDGLFTIGEIYKEDLNDPEAARTAFQEFLRSYPNHRLAADARQAIVEMDQQAKAERADQAHRAAEKKRLAKSGARHADDLASQGTSQGRSPYQGTFQGSSQKTSEAGDGSVVRTTSKTEESAGAGERRWARVTGIRHWSTPDYTRVAIDVESGVKYSSMRIESPARIFFDLRGTKLASTLVGKSFDVDDGFLKKVRVAEFAPGRTRVVLEVDNLADYDSFLLPNPYRLIIDIHGKNGRAKAARDSGEGALTSSEGAPAAKTAVDAEDDSTSAESRLETKAETLNPGVRSVAKTSVPSSSSSGAAAERPAPVMVKRIVDADDDDDSDNSTAAARRDSAGKKSETSITRNPGPTKNSIHGSRDGNSDLSPASDPGADSSGKAEGRLLASGKGVESSFSVREARPTASGDRSLIRALGLKIGKIVIDPGHGGHDTGTIGPNGLEEKDLALDVSRRLGKLLEARLGAEVVYTRKDDTFIPLETRTAIANQARADLFISIHANSSHDETARGVETYYLNFTSSPEALEVAARENAVSEASIYQLQDLVKKIALKEKIEESREFAWDVQQSLHSGLAAKSPAVRDRGVKKAPFIVLIGANMPSILAEISFVSNPTDEHRLATSEYRQRIAESLYGGIAKYVNGLSGVKVASKMDKAAGQ
jgi:N-acetylmuramoyl-L-alanine amidase